jgi:hypothetical protein
MGYFSAEYFGGSAGGSGTALLIDRKRIIRIVRNDAYDGVANPIFTFGVTRDYTGWTGTLTIRHRSTGLLIFAKAITVESDIYLTISMTSEETAFPLLTSNEDFGPHPFDIQMIDGDSRQTIRGIAVITRDVTLT